MLRYCFMARICSDLSTKAKPNCFYMSQEVMGQDLYPVYSVIEKKDKKSEHFSHCYICAFVFTSSDYLLTI